MIMCRPWATLFARYCCHPIPPAAAAWPKEPESRLRRVPRPTWTFLYPRYRLGRCANNEEGNYYDAEPDQHKVHRQRAIPSREDPLAWFSGETTDHPADPAQIWRAIELQQKQGLCREY